MTNEEWRPVLGYESHYQVSNLGSVRRLSRGKKFTHNQIIEAKTRLVGGAKLKDVAAFLKTSITTVMSIKHGKTWVGDPEYRSVTPGVVNGYRHVMPCVNGVYGRFLVHRAVWEAFNGPIPGRLEINHMNLDRGDNRLENLELLTHRQNVQHAHDIYKSQMIDVPKGKRRGPKSKYAKARAAQNELL